METRHHIAYFLMDCELGITSEQIPNSLMWNTHPIPNYLNLTRCAQYTMGLFQTYQPIDPYSMYYTKISYNWNGRFSIQICLHCLKGRLTRSLFEIEDVQSVCSIPNNTHMMQAHTASPVRGSGTPTTWGFIVKSK